MDMDHLRAVSPDDLVAVAAEDRDSVLLATFDQPLEPDAVQRLVADLATRPTEPEDIDIRVIRHTPEVTDSTALSLERLPPHTDGSFLGSPPLRFVLACQRADDEGAGASTFISVDDIVVAAPGWVVHGLSLGHFRFLKTYDGDLTESFIGPVLSRRQDGAWLMRWRADHLYRPEPVKDHGTRAADAAAWLHEYAETCAPVVHPLTAGQLALIPNGRYLHGRGALSQASDRCIFRAWVF
jgi:hypothetical protein